MISSVVVEFAADSSQVSRISFVLYLIAALTTIAALGIAWKKSREAKSAVARGLDELPRMVSEALRSIASARQQEETADTRAIEGWLSSVDCADVNEDGRKELLVQYPTRAHGSALRILAWRESRFEELGYVRTGTPVGFEFGDFDGDGKVEIRTQETDWSTGLPYVTAPRVILLLRWDGTTFSEVSRRKA